MRGIAYCLLIVPNLILHQPAQNIFGLSFGLFAVFYLAILFAVILVHESGHAIAVRLAGWQVRTFAVFPFIYRFEKRQYGLWTAASGDLGGMVTYKPVGPVTPGKTAWIASAGSLANMAFALAMFLLASAELGSVVENIAGALAITSLFVGLGNLLPWKSSGSSSDGYVLLGRLKASRKRVA